MTSHLYITPKSNYDEQARRAVDADLISKKSIAWGTKVQVHENIDALATSGDLSLLASSHTEMNIEDIDKDSHLLVIDDEEFKVISSVSKPDPSDINPNAGPKDFTMDDVKKIAEELMKANGSTTSLDVKNELRTRGHWAKQQKVSDFMKALHAQYPDWDTSNNGTYNTYFLTDDSDDDDDDTTSMGTVANTARTPRVSAANIASAFTVTYQPPVTDYRSEALQAIENAIKNHALQVSGFLNTEELWVAYCPETKEVALYEDSLNSDSVRNAFRKMIGKRIQKVRACRYKNVKHWTL